MAVYLLKAAEVPGSVLIRDPLLILIPYLPKLTNQIQGSVLFSTAHSHTFFIGFYRAPDIHLLYSQELLS